MRENENYSIWESLKRQEGSASIDHNIINKARNKEHKKSLSRGEGKGSVALAVQLSKGYSYARVLKF